MQRAQAGVISLRDRQHVIAQIKHKAFFGTGSVGFARGKGQGCSVRDNGHGVRQIKSDSDIRRVCRQWINILGRP
ncbi:hypothetical protein [Tateyamaria sp.]|uniref:hypothetical protein n=1 Tax=Tateyamaria sp. TaxID=1929288 RepID=UPI003B21DD9E